MSTIEDEIQDSANKVKEVSYQLWQSLLTINGFLITILIGIVALSDVIKLQIIKDLIFWTVIFLFLSSTCIIISFLSIRSVYKRIYNVLYEAHFLNKTPDENNEFFASIAGIIKLISEIVALVLQLISAIMLIIFLHYILYPTH